MTKAIIRWVSELNGGKKEVPYINEKYYPMLKIKKQENIFDWSFVVVNLEKMDELTTLAQVYFLMDNAPKSILVAGLEFSLFEGSRLVASGIIQ